MASLQSEPPPRGGGGGGGGGGVGGTYEPVAKPSASERKFYSSHGLVDQKDRPVDVHCPASTAPAWMVNITSAAELVRGYYNAAGVEPPRKRPKRKKKH